MKRQCEYILNSQTAIAALVRGLDTALFDVVWAAVAKSRGATELKRKQSAQRFLATALLLDEDAMATLRRRLRDILTGDSFMYLVSESEVHLFATTFMESFFQFLVRSKLRSMSSLHRDEAYDLGSVNLNCPKEMIAYCLGSPLLPVSIVTFVTPSLI